MQAFLGKRKRSYANWRWVWNENESKLISPITYNKMSGDLVRIKGNG